MQYPVGEIVFASRHMDGVEVLDSGACFSYNPLKNVSILSRGILP